MMIFERGQRVRFIRDNTDGGGQFGIKNESVILHNPVSHRTDKVYVTRSTGEVVFAYIKDLEPDELKYKPDQQPDEDTDL